MPTPDLDLGDDHYATFTGSGGEGITRDGQPVPRVEKIGIIVLHRCPKSATGWWEGYAGFDLPDNVRA